MSQERLCVCVCVCVCGMYTDMWYICIYIWYDAFFTICKKLLNNLVLILGNTLVW